MKKIDTDEINLSDYLLINKGTLLIPFSQRPYEWGDNQVRRLFYDLVGLYDLDENQIHMLNFFTFSGEENELKIFDGQQRTVTLLLLTAVFIKMLNKLGNGSAAKQFYTDYLVQKNFRTKETSEKRKISFDEQEINELFYEIVDYTNNREYDFHDYSNISSKSIVKNYQTLQKLLDSFVEERDLNKDEVLELFNKVLDNSQLITIQTETDELAMAMFETLNNTGKRLENYYVLKNDLVSILSEEGVRNRWNKIEGNLESFSPSNFLVSYATIESGKITKDSVLKKIYELYEKNNAESMGRLLDGLVKASRFYLEIVNPSQLNIRGEGQETKKYKELAQALSLFGVTQHYSLLLAMRMRNMPIVSINKILASILNLAIRNFYFKEKRANEIEKPIADLARKTYVDQIDEQSILRELKKMMIQDGDLKIAIKIKKVETKAEERKLKYILKESYNFNDLKGELKIKDSLDNIHYEHILPQKPSEKSQWLVDFPNEDERKNYTQNVGNCMLLLDKLNLGVSNQDFIHKKEKYVNSKIPENLSIAKREKWTKSEIDERNQIIAQKIINFLQELDNSLVK